MGGAMKDDLMERLDEILGLHKTHAKNLCFECERDHPPKAHEYMKNLRNFTLDTVDVLESLRDRLQSQQWVSVEEFQMKHNEGYCRIVYKGRVTEAYHDHNQKFLFSKMSRECFLTECITAVMPIAMPTPPEDKA